MLPVFVWVESSTSSSCNVIIVITIIIDNLEWYYFHHHHFCFFGKKSLNRYIYISCSSRLFVHQVLVLLSLINMLLTLFVYFFIVAGFVKSTDKQDRRSWQENSIQSSLSVKIIRWGVSFIGFTVKQILAFSALVTGNKNTVRSQISCQSLLEIKGATTHSECSF